jgi:hypothetical protein
MIYFRHPDLKMRREEFGGLVQTRIGLHALNHEEYKYLLCFEETVTDEPDEQLQQFVEIGAILAISEEEAAKADV